MESEAINHLKEQINKKIGKKVKIRISRGRHRVDILDGVIEATYPSVFTVSVKKNPRKREKPKTMSFSYNDILTRDVQLKLK